MKVSNDFKPDNLVFERVVVTRGQLLKKLKSSMLYSRETMYNKKLDTSQKFKIDQGSFVF